MNPARLAIDVKTERLYEEIEAADLSVVENARHFRINEAAIDDFFPDLPRKPDNELLDDTIHLADPENKERILNYLFALEAVNFGGAFSGRLRSEGFYEKGLGLYETVALRLKKYFGKNEYLPAADMAKLKTEDIAGIFGFDLTKLLSAEYAEMFTVSMSELGEFVRDNFEGSFGGLLDAAEGSVENLVSTLRQLSKFADTHPYTLRNGHEIEVPILKRAQHVAGSIPLAFRRVELEEPFYDLHKLTAFPDNKISLVMIAEGILESSEKMGHVLENRIPVPISSEMEVEYRVLGRHIVRLMSQKTGFMQMDIDHWIWEHSHGNCIKTGRPYIDLPCLTTNNPSFNY